MSVQGSLNAISGCRDWACYLGLSCFWLGGHWVCSELWSSGTPRHAVGRRWLTVTDHGLAGIKKLGPFLCCDYHSDRLRGTFLHYSYCYHAASSRAAGCEAHDFHHYFMSRMECIASVVSRGWTGRSFQSRHPSW